MVSRRTGLSATAELSCFKKATESMGRGRVTTTSRAVARGMLGGVLRLLRFHKQIWQHRH